MKRIGSIILFVAIAAALMTKCALDITQPVEAAPKATTTRMPKATQPIPTATIGYEATAQVAQETANAALAIANAANLEQARITADAEERIHAETMAAHDIIHMSLDLENTKVAATQTAAPRSIPATQTHEAFVVEQSEDIRTMQSVRATETAYGPELTRQQAQADNFHLYKLIQLCILGLIIFWLVAMFSFLKRRTTLEIERERTKQAAMKKDYGKIAGEGEIKIRFKNGTRTWDDIIPCTPALLLEWAEGMRDGKSMAINEWEGAETEWTRDLILPFRQFLVRNGLASRDNNNIVTLTMVGEVFWQDVWTRETAPPLFDLHAGEVVNHGETAHMSGNHGEEVT